MTEDQMNELGLEPIEPKNSQVIHIADTQSKNPFLRTILPFPLATTLDILRQFYQPGIPQNRM